MMWLPKNNKTESRDKDKVEDKPNFVADTYKAHSKWWLVLIKYVVVGGIASAMVVVSLHLRNYFGGGLDQLTTYRYLADAFTFPAALFILLGLLVLIARQGTFSGLFYALRHVARMMVPFLIRKDITYADFIERYSERRKGGPLLCFFLVGFICLIVAVIFIIIFSCNGG